jgi:chitinase
MYDKDWYKKNTSWEKYVADVKNKDMVNHPQHYTQGGIETIDYLQAKLSKDEFVGYLKGNILKYMSRANLKNGTEDYKKAQWYINKLVEVSKSE